MNTLKNLAIILAVFGVFISSAHGQSFLNLNFESAYNLPENPGQGASIGTTNGLPDWIAYDGASALYNVYYASNTSYSPNASVGLYGGSLALSGNFSVALYFNSAIKQTGLVPDNAESLQFEAQGLGPGGSLRPGDLSVTIAGRSLAFSALSEDPDYYVYGANIPAVLDGQMELLAFGVQNAGQVLLDNIEFSMSSVPEPGGWALIGVGVVLFGVLRPASRRLRRGESLRRGKTARHGRGKQDKLVSF